MKKMWEGGGFGNNCWNQKVTQIWLDWEFSSQPKGATYGGCGTEEISSHIFWFLGITPNPLVKVPRLQIRGPAWLFGYLLGLCPLAKTQESPESPSLVSRVAYRNLREIAAFGENDTTKLVKNEAIWPWFEGPKVKDQGELWT